MELCLDMWHVKLHLNSMGTSSMLCGLSSVSVISDTCVVTAGERVLFLSVQFCFS